MGVGSFLDNTGERGNFVGLPTESGLLAIAVSR